MTPPLATSHRLFSLVRLIVASLARAVRKAQNERRVRAFGLVSHTRRQRRSPKEEEEKTTDVRSSRRCVTDVIEFLRLLLLRRMRRRVDDLSLWLSIHYNLCPARERRSCVHAARPRNSSPRLLDPLLHPPHPHPSKPRLFLSLNDVGERSISFIRSGVVVGHPLPSS